MTAWRDIPGNEHAFDQLRALLTDRRSISFVGAGASASLYPLWGGLITSLVEETKKRGRGNDDERVYWLKQRDAYPDQVVRGVKAALGEGIYAEVLRRIFGPKAGPDGNHFTPVHAALIRLPFRAHVTTNFDPGLLEARLALRPDLRGTGYATWKDADAVARWQNADIFAEEPCPILFAHGSWEKNDSIVLGMGEYREAYRPGAFRRLFDYLWTTEHLVFAGFGFADDWVKFVANEVLTARGKRTTEPRHIALIGLPSDEAYTPFMRDLFVDQYDAEPLFYPVIKSDGRPDDHSALLDILLALGGGAPPAASGTRPGGSPAAPPPPTAPPADPGGTSAMAERWVHETTEDERFTGRAATLERLDRWCADPAVRVIGVTGMGGLGKTSLIGHWLKQRNGAQGRPFTGVFFWSFYADLEVANFAKAFVAFMTDALRVRAPPENTEPGDAALAMLQARHVLLVLDGLEVLQERPDQPGYGEFLTQDLSDLLDGACRRTAGSLVVLTSRFPFPDLTPYLGIGFRALDLEFLSPSEGAALLHAAGVGGTAVDRGEVSRRFEGHPLALRVFGLTREGQAKGDPTRLVDRIFDAAHAEENGTLEGKMSRLLLFYEQRLPRERVALLGLVSLFRAPVPEATILTLARDLPAAADALGGQTDAALRRALEAIAHEHLLIRNPAEDGSSVWSCHPVLRDHFRATFLGWGVGTAASAAGLLSSEPSRDRPTSVKQLQPVLTAIDLLLDAGDFQGALRLYQERLEDGNIFKWLPAPAEGERCTLGFVSGIERRKACERALGRSGLACMLNTASVLAAIGGEFAEALAFRRDVNTIVRQINEHQNLGVSLRNEAEILFSLGKLAASESAAHDALAAARATEIKPDLHTRQSLCYIANALAGQGKSGEALVAFDAAKAIGRRTSPDSAELRSYHGVMSATLMIRLGLTERARAITEANLRACERYGWQEDVARCRTLLGVLATLEGRFPDAARHLTEAERVFRRAHQIRDLPTTLLTRAGLERRQGGLNEALATVEAALHLAAPRKMLLDQADALVLRGCIRLDWARAAVQGTERLEAERAGDDLDQALSLARSCGYAWAERDALTHLAEVHVRLGDEARAAALGREAETLSRRLLDTTPPDPNPFAWAIDG
jgi:tetratricopeptide (TPR) repeat protein